MTVAPIPTLMITTASGFFRCVDLRAAAGDMLPKMPYVHRILLENVLRQDNPALATAGRDALLAWLATGRSAAEIPFSPTRILMHDTTCGPALTDIAAMRDALAEAGGDPDLLNPAVPVATSTDHSAPVDYFGTADAAIRNLEREFQRNGERYQFMKWATNAIDGFRVFPPGTGIMHTINMERLATIVSTVKRDGATWAVPDTLVGTDSHTPMVNALGVLGWGVGGIEAEGVMFGVPVTLRVPEVIGVRLIGRLPEGSTSTDFALRVTELLREAGCGGEFVEFFGPGVASLTAGERGPAANMAPEYGGSTGYFPIDAHTVDYLRATGRDEAQCALVETYAQATGLWFDPTNEPRYTSVLEIDLSALRPSLAGPRRPQDRLEPAQVPAALRQAMADGDAVDREVAACTSEVTIPMDAVAIAAITSCTNTTDTGLLIAAGLVARRARERGLLVPFWVKTSLGPGSPAAERRLRRAGLLDDLEAMGFAIVGYGCTTCIGNSGPLVAAVAEAVERREVNPVAVLSGNRNFPGRVHAQIELALLASPPLVVAYAIAGRAMLDITADPLGTDAAGTLVYLADLWPRRGEVDALLQQAIDPADIAAAAAETEAAESWVSLPAPSSARFPWAPDSTYLRRPPFVAFSLEGPAPGPLVAHPLLVLGDDVTTDHISPAGSIPARSDAGIWLTERGENPADLNVYASRRGNWEVMLRGLFTNRTLVNRLCPSAPPGHSVFAPTGEVLPVWRVAGRYAEAGHPVVIVAGERYGTGSSRDWAAKGAQLLGVRAVLANSFERIHRANLIGMGIVPLQIPPEWSAEHMQIAAADTIEIEWDLERLSPRSAVPVTLLRAATGERLTIEAIALTDTAREVQLIQEGGIIPMILRQALAASRQVSSAA
jgi:aconitate hydratase